MSSVMTTNGYNSNDMNQVTLGFPNLFYETKDGSNIFHMMARIPDAFINNIERFILAINAGVDINKPDNENETPLIKAVRCTNDVMVFYMIDNNLCNINYCYNHNIEKKISVNAFTWACINSNFNTISKLIHNGSTYNINVDLEFIKDHNIKSRVAEFILNYSEDPLTDEETVTSFNNEDITFFDEDDFFNERKGGSGVYGDINIVIEKKTGRRCAIKLFKDRNVNVHSTSKYKDIGFEGKTTCRDINSLKILKRLSHTVNLYGAIYKDNKLYMVTEYLKHTVGDHFSLIKMSNYSKENKERRYKEILRQVLQCIDENSKAGFVHCDIKYGNLMIDRYNQVKMIDYGLAFYLGICPFIGIVDHERFNSNFVCKDGWNALTTLTNQQDNTKTIVYNNRYFSFQKDIPSVAIMLISMLFGKGSPYYYKPLFSFNDKVYIYAGFNLKDPTSKGFYNEMNTFERDILQYISYEMYEFLLKLLEIDPAKRLTAIELLHSNFFGEVEIEYPNDLDLTMIPIQESPKSRIDSVIDSYLTLSNENYRFEGFPYFDSIVSFYSNDKLPAVHDVYNNEFIDIIIRMFVTLIDYKDCIDSIINFMFYFLENRRNIENTIGNNNRLFCESVLSVIFYTDFFDDMYLSLAKIASLDLRNPSHLEKYNKLEDNIVEYSKHFYSNKNIYNIRPVMLFICYIKFILQCVCTNTLRIRKLIKDTLVRFIRYVLFSHYTRGIELRIYDIIAACYCSLPEMIDINIRPSDSNLITVVSNVTCNSKLEEQFNKLLEIQ